MPWNWRAQSVEFCGERETSTKVILIFVNLTSHSHPGPGVDHRYKKQKLVQLNFRDTVQRKVIWKELVALFGNTLVVLLRLLHLTTCHCKMDLDKYVYILQLICASHTCHRGSNQHE